MPKIQYDMTPMNLEGHADAFLVIFSCFGVSRYLVCVNLELTLTLLYLDKNL